MEQTQNKLHFYAITNSKKVWNWNQGQNNSYTYRIK